MVLPEIVQHLQDNDLTQALRVLNGPPRLASQDQTEQELPKLYKPEAQPTPAAKTHQLNPAHVQQIHYNITHILKHHPKHRGAGPAGDRYEHYAIVYKSPIALQTMSDTLTLLATNNVPQSTLDAIASARLIPLLKPNNKIRPIACGTILRRVVTAATAKVVTPMIAETIDAHQYAIGRPNGAEELHKYVQARLDQDSDLAILSVDVQAAFSDIHLAAILESTQTHHSDLEPLIRPWLTADALYLCDLQDSSDTLTLKSGRGVPMGCPLAAAAFTLALHTALSKMQLAIAAVDPGASTTAYMDDINILTKQGNLSKALDAAKHELHQLGLQLNDAKTECWINPCTVAAEDSYQGIPRTQRPTVLKASAEPMPIIPDDLTNPTQILNERAPELQRLVTKRMTTATRLQQLHSQGLSTHIAQALWRTATASDATFTARTVGIDNHTATKLDKITVEMFQQWIDAPLTPTDRLRLFDAIKEQGFGFTSTLHIKDTALIASWQQVAPRLLRQLNKPDMSSLLAELPNTRRQL